MAQDAGEPDGSGVGEVESMIHYPLHIQEMRRQIKRQADALPILGDRFAGEAQCQYRQDQARSLDDLKKRVEQEVKNVERMEAASSIGSMKGAVIFGLANFAIGSICAAAIHSDEHPLSVGLQFAANSLERTAPFGNIVIAVGPRGVPDDVEVIPLSKIARQQDKEESEVTATLESSYHVMSVESFSDALEELKGKVLEGRLTLPVSASYWNHQSKQPQNTYSCEVSSFLLSPQA